MLAALYATGLACLSGAAGLRVGSRLRILGRDDWSWLIPLVLLPVAAGVVVALQTILVWS